MWKNRKHILGGDIYKLVHCNWANHVRKLFSANAYVVLKTSSWWSHLYWIVLNKFWAHWDHRIAVWSPYYL